MYQSPLTNRKYLTQLYYGRNNLLAENRAHNESGVPLPLFATYCGESARPSTFIANHVGRNQRRCIMSRRFTSLLTIVALAVGALIVAASPVLAQRGGHVVGSRGGFSGGGARAGFHGGGIGSDFRSGLRNDFRRGFRDGFRDGFHDGIRTDFRRDFRLGFFGGSFFPGYFGYGFGLNRGFYGTGISYPYTSFGY